MLCRKDDNVAAQAAFYDLMVKHKRRAAVPERVAHLIGFSSKCRVDGRRLYIPTTTPDTAIKES
ncbi:hypothetical protein ABZ682_18480 [Streptomyces griseoviridis]|uniref:hypothetical protein n=1 Tax=Streptomyces griseoviridis TaxID=45398 RepID=UPI0033BFCE41